MSRRDPRLLIQDILDATSKIKTFTSSQSFEEFVVDSKTIDVVIRNFVVIGEAANNIPEVVKDKYSKIEWFRIRGFRNRIVNHYFWN